MVSKKRQEDHLLLRESISRLVKDIKNSCDIWGGSVEGSNLHAEVQQRVLIQSEVLKNIVLVAKDLTHVDTCNFSVQNES